MKKIIRNPNLIYWIFGLFVAMLPLFWFRDNFLILGRDALVPLNIGFIKNQLYLWDPILYLGHDYAGLLPMFFPYYVLYWLVLNFGGSLIFAQKIWFIFTFAFPYFSMGYLFSVLLKEKNINTTIAKTLASLFYAFNLYVLMRWHDGTYIVLLAYAATPLILAFFIKAFETKKYFYYLILMSLFSLLFAPAAGNLPMILTSIFIPLGILAIFLAFREKKWQPIFYFLLFLVFYFLINLWWLAPFLNKSLNLITAANENNTGFGWPDIAFQKSGFLGTLQLQGHWLWWANWAGRGFYSFAKFYQQNFFFVFLSLIPFAIILFYLFLAKKKNSFWLYFLILFLFFAIFAAGIQPPFGFIYKWLYQHFPLFWLFRSPPTKFEGVLAFSYAVFIGFFSFWLIDVLKKWRWLYFILMISFILIFSWPLLTGLAVIEKAKGLWPSHLVKIPAFFDELKQYLNNQKGEFKLIQIPKQNYGFYQWGNEGTDGIDILPQIINRPVVQETEFTDTAKSTNEFVKKIYQIINEPKTPVSQLLGLANVKYVIERNDIPWDYYDELSPQKRENNFLSQGLEKERTIGLFNLYKIKEASFQPTIYPSQNVFYLGKEQSLTKLFDNQIDKKQMVFFQEESQDKKEKTKKLLDLTNYLLIKRMRIIIDDPEFLTDSRDWGIDRPVAIGSPTLKVNNNASSNNKLSYKFKLPCPEKYQVAINLLVDDKPGDLSWEIKTEKENFQGILRKTSYPGNAWEIKEFNLGNFNLTESNEIIFHNNYGFIGINEIKIYPKEIMSCDVISANQKLPEISFQKINPVHYKVEVKNATSPYFLNFAESYNSLWQAKINNKGRINDNNHFVANGFANSWYLEKTGDYIIDIYYKPQQIFIISSIISIVSVLNAIIYLIFRRIKNGK